MTWFDWLQPDSIDNTAFFLLIALSFVTSALTVVLGLGGGVTLLAFMGNVMPAAAIIPVHGLVQLGSNFGRAYAMRCYVVWRIVRWMSLGSIVGVIIGGQIVVSLPAHWLQLVLGCFVLYSAWLPMWNTLGRGRSMTLVGVISAFISMFVGASGPFLIGILKDALDKRQIIGTMAAIMSLQHFMKVIAFTLFGFMYSDWAGLIMLMIITGFLGTLTGRFLLDRMSDDRFKWILKVLLTVLSLRLIYKGLSTLFGWTI